MKTLKFRGKNLFLDLMVLTSTMLNHAVGVENTSLYKEK